MNLKKIGNVFTSKFFGTGPSSYKKKNYRAAVSQRLRNTAVDGGDWVITVSWCILVTLYFDASVGDVIFSLNKGKYLFFIFFYSFIGKIVYTIYFGYLDKLYVTYEIYAWFLLEYRLLKFLALPEDDSSLLW